jgi:hypothetical protein
MPVQMDQIAAYAMIAGFLIFASILLLTQVITYHGEKHVAYPLSAGGKPMNCESSNKRKCEITDVIGISVFFLLLAVLLILVARAETRKGHSP